MGHEWVGPGPDNDRPDDVDASPEALAWVTEVLDARTTVCEQLSTGSLSLADVLDGRRWSPALGATHLLVLLESLPGASKVATRRKLARLGISERVALEDLGEDELRMLCEEFPIADPGDVRTW